MVLEKGEWAVLRVEFVILGILAEVPGVPVEVGILGIVCGALPLIVHNEQVAPLEQPLLLVRDHHVALLERDVPDDAQLAVLLLVITRLLLA